MSVIKVPSLDTDDQVFPERLGSGTPDSLKFLRGDKTWAIPPGIISISEDNIGVTDVVIGSGWYCMKAHQLEANSYSKIRVRACGYVFGNYANLLLEGYIDIKIGNYFSPKIRFRVPSTGAGDWFYIPFAIETSNTQQSAAPIWLEIFNQTTQTFQWAVTNFCVEGIR